jgi:predicted ester cyclase
VFAMDSRLRLLPWLFGGVLIGLATLAPALGVGHARATDDAESQTTTTCPTTTDEQNIAIARAWHEEVINRRNPGVLQDILAPRVMHHAAGGYPDSMTVDGVAAMMNDFLVAFSDLHYAFDLFIVQGNYVVERYTATGTQDGPLGNLPPSGRRATWTGVNIFRIECGRIAEVWSEVDALTRNQQLTGPGK